MRSVRAKKGLGQHFLKDQEIASSIVAALQEKIGDQAVLEIGPGMGILTAPLLQFEWSSLHVIEIAKTAKVQFQEVACDQVFI